MGLWTRRWRWGHWAGWALFGLGGCFTSLPGGDDEGAGDDDDDMMIVGGDDDDDDDDGGVGADDAGSRVEDAGVDAGPGDAGKMPDEDGGTLPPSDFAPFDVIDGFIPAAGGDAMRGGAPPAFLDTSATFIGAEAPGTAPRDAWWADWATSDGNDGCPAGRTRTTVDADITTPTIWTNDRCYTLTTQVYVVGTEARPTVLTIEPGTYIEGTLDDTALIITTTARIEANGVRGNPIIFTSAEDPGSRKSGDWGGLILLGRASLNVGGDGSASIEGLRARELAEYGGADDAHDCGTLEYVRVEWTGFALSDANEITGITFGGCGTDTTAHHVQTFVGFDDGIEILGGTMNLSYALVAGQEDDGFDVDQGWRGALQYAISWNFGGERSNEWDNNFDDGNRNNLPRTEPNVWNATYIGLNGPGRECFRIRGGAAADINNVLCQDFSEDQCVEIQHIETGSQVVAGNLTINDSIFNNCGTPFRFRVADECTTGPCSTNAEFPVVDCDRTFPDDAFCVLPTPYVPPFAAAGFDNVINSTSSRVTAPPTP